VKSKVQPRLLLNMRLLPVLVGLLLVLQLTLPYRGWLILLVGLCVMWLISFLWARSLSRKLQLTREVRFGWAQVGDGLEERFVLTNSGWAPAVWAEIEDHSTLPDYRASRATGVGGGELVRWHTEGTCTRRGLFTLGPTSLQTGDPLGVYTVSLHYPGWATLMVVPPIVPLPTIEVAAGGKAGEGRPRANAFERTVSTSGVRDYLPGDNMRWIHWPVSAHHDSLYVRLFDSIPAGDWWIFLDLDRAVQAGQGYVSTEEHGVILAASLADRGIRARRSVGLVAHGGEQLTWRPPQAGEGQRWAILRDLALVTPGPCPLVELLARVRPALGQLASLIIITPAVDGRWVESLVPLLRRGAVATVLLFDPVSFGGTGQVSGALALLSNLGVVCHVINREVLDRPQARPGHGGQWEWRVMPTGRAVPIRQPRDLGWKVLS
jgi:uncharacterized protein (DUF58 family)